MLAHYKRRIPYLCLLVLTGFTYFLFVITFAAVLRGIGEKDVFAVITVSSELIFALLVESTYMSILRSRRTKKAFNKFFLLMLLTTLAGLLGDVLSWGIGFSHLSFAPIVMEIGFVVSRLAAFPLIVLYSTYLISYVDDDPGELKRYAWLVGGLSANGALLVLLSIATVFDPVYPWALPDHPWVYFFFLCLPISVNIAIILSFRRRLNNRKALSFLTYEILVVAVVVIDTMVKSITFAYIAVAYSMLQLYISIQIEYETQQEEALVQQRISIMRSQIQPHFLYNVLTGIRSLCRSDPEKAEQALTNFTIYLRGNLNSIESADCIPFVQELDHVRHYVELEKMRYGSALQVKFNISVTEFSLPPLSVEPMVENAIRHGIMAKKGKGMVVISTQEKEKDFVITVSDNGSGFDTTSLEELDARHIGLSNVRERISSMCSGSISVSSVVGVGTDVSISIPKIDVT